MGEQADIDWAQNDADEAEQNLRDALNSAAKPKMNKRERKPTFDPDYIRDLSEKAYRLRLIQDGGEDEPARMIAKDKDNGEKLRNRASSYDPLTRAYLQVLGFEPPALQREEG